MDAGRHIGFMGEGSFLTWI